MREYNVKLSPFNLTGLKSITGQQSENSHGVYQISGIIPVEKVSEYMTLGLEDIEAELTAVDADLNEKAIFRGVVTDFQIEIENDVPVLNIEVTSGTFLLDRIPHVRTFQDEGITYSSMLSTVTGPHGADFIMSRGDGVTIKEGTVAQYQETDWAFAKRLASHFNTVLIPNNHMGGKKFYFGPPSRPAQHKLSSDNYSVRRVKGKLSSDSGESGPAKDIVYYIIREREIYYLGDCIVLNGRELYVSSIDSELIGSELYHTYSLKQKDDFCSPKIYNYTVIGASLDGKILSVQKDVVKMTVTGDENAASAGSRWYVYSTVYSSPDGTGWYCMPEPGDAVRLYFPTMDESQAYVISSTHSPSSARSNPDNKSIKNKQNKEVLLMPDKVVVTNNKGMSVVLDDAQGVTIVSDKDIIIDSKESIQITCGEEVLVAAADAIKMEQGGTTLSLSEVVGMLGAQVRLD